MIRAVIAFAVLAAVIAGATWLADHPGAVTIDWWDYRIETSLAFLGAGVAVTCVVAAFLSRFWWSLRRFPRRASQRWREGRREQGYRALTQGMVALAAGDSQEARRQAQKAVAMGAPSPLTLLLSAQAAQLQGEGQAAKGFFTAMLGNPDTAFLALRGLIGQAMREGDDATAMRLIEQARELRPKTPWAITTLFDLQARAGHWRMAEKSLKDATRKKIVAQDEGARKLAILLVEQSRGADAGGQASEALSLAEKAHKRDPSLIPATVRLLGLLGGAGRERRARNVAHKAWAAGPHLELSRAYAGIKPEEDPLARYQRFRKLCSYNPGHEESHLALARAALDAKLWGEARNNLAKLASSELSRRLCLTMAELEEKEHQDMATAHYWLSRAAAADPDPAWVCCACGTVPAAWSALCGSCGAFATLDWRVPGREGERVVGAPSPVIALPVDAAPSAP